MTMLFDGAMGTYWQGSGSVEEAVLTDPEAIAAIYEAYLKAGAQAIKTDTFSVGNLLADGEEGKAEAILSAASRIAQTAAQPYEAKVFGDMGPVQADGEERAADLFLWQAKRFLQAGITHFLVETLPGLLGIGTFARKLKELAPDSFLLVSFAISPDGMSVEGLDGKALYETACAIPEIDAVGFNCMSGPSHLARFVRDLPRLGKPISLMPNAGYPTVLGRKVVYSAGPDWFAGQVASAGADIVGGCCGTTPAHIASLKLALKRKAPVKTGDTETVGQPEIRQAENPLWEKLQAGKKVIAVELDPPVNDDIAPFLASAKVLGACGVDAITIADSPVGRPRANSCLVAAKIKRELGLEPLPHLTCRDRNLIATKALLLGLSMEGIHNVLLVTGDPVPTADRDEVRSVFNFNSRKLARYVSEANRTLFQSPFCIYGALNLNARNFEKQLALAKEKEENGVQVFLTQPVLSKQALDNLKIARRELSAKILAGIFPVVSERNALFLNNEVAGIEVCEEIVRLYKGKGREEGEEIALRVCQAVISAVWDHCDGLYIMTPFSRVHLVEEIIKKIPAQSCRD